jgi:hypothetical protein
MTPVLIVDNILLALLVITTLALLRSFGEIVRQVDSAGPTKQETRLPPSLGSANGVRTMTDAHDIVGQMLDGSSIKVSVTSHLNTLVAFLSSGCTSCEPFWLGLTPKTVRTLPPSTRVVIVTKDSTYESPSRLKELAPKSIRLVMSSDAWTRYGVATSPYFAYVDGASAQIMSEGTASGWDQVLSLLRDALADQEMFANGRGLSSRSQTPG